MGSCIQGKKGRSPVAGDDDRRSSARALVEPNLKRSVPSLSSSVWNYRPSLDPRTSLTIGHESGTFFGNSDSCFSFPPSPDLHRVRYVVDPSLIAQAPSHQVDSPFLSLGGWEFGQHTSPLGEDGPLPSYALRLQSTSDSLFDYFLAADLQHSKSAGPGDPPPYSPVFPVACVIDSRPQSGSFRRRAQGCHTVTEHKPLSPKASETQAASRGCLTRTSLSGPHTAPLKLPPLSAPTAATPPRTSPSTRPARNRTRCTPPPSPPLAPNSPRMVGARCSDDAVDLNKPHRWVLEKSLLGVGVDADADVAPSAAHPSSPDSLKLWEGRRRCSEPINVLVDQRSDPCMRTVKSTLSITRQHNVGGRHARRLRRMYEQQLVPSTPLRGLLPAALSAGAAYGQPCSSRSPLHASSPFAEPRPLKLVCGLCWKLMHIEQHAAVLPCGHLFHLMCLCPLPSTPPAVAAPSLWLSPSGASLVHHAAVSPPYVPPVLAAVSGESGQRTARSATEAPTGAEHVAEVEVLPVLPLVEELPQTPLCPLCCRKR